MHRAMSFEESIQSCNSHRNQDMGISINSKTSAMLCFYQVNPDLQILATSGLFFCLTVSPLQNVIEYVVWLLSFSIMHSGLMYVAHVWVPVICCLYCWVMFDFGVAMQFGHQFTSCCSVTQSCSTLCDPKDCSTPSFPVLHHLPELTQTHDH